MSEPAFQVYGWFSYLSAAATVLTLITGILFFAIGKPFGKLNDISSVFQVLFMIPLVIMFVHISPAHKFILNLVAASIGITGMLVSAYGQSMLVIGRIDFQASLKFFPAGGAIGIWLVMISVFTASDGFIPIALTWIGMLAGLGYLLTVIGFLRSGPRNVLFSLGGLILGIAYPTWSIWLGKLLCAGL